MRRTASICCIALVLSSVSVSAGLGPDDPSLDLSESVVLRASSKAQVAGGRLIDETIKELDQRSATFDEILRTLVVSHILTFISPAVDQGLASGMYGRTRFAVSALKIVAFIEVITPMDQLPIRREAIAHELAHVVEVACLGRIDSNEVLRQRLLPRLPRFSNATAAHEMETRFAVRVGRAVLREAQENGRGPSQLARLSELEGLTACPAVAPGRHGSGMDPLG